MLYAGEKSLKPEDNFFDNFLGFLHEHFTAQNPAPCGRTVLAPRLRGGGGGSGGRVGKSRRMVYGLHPPPQWRFRIDLATQIIKYGRKDFIPNLGFVVWVLARVGD